MNLTRVTRQTRDVTEQNTISEVMTRGSSTVPEVEGGCVDNDITGQGEGLSGEQDSQRQIQRSEKHSNTMTVNTEEEVKVKRSCVVLGKYL